MNKQIEEYIAVIEIEKELCGKPCDICKANNEHCMPHRMAKKLAAKGWRKSSDVAMEIFEEIEKYLAMYSHIHRYAEEANKVTEEYADGSPVEMTSVWDACRLEHNGYDDYGTMCELQDNIGYIAKSNLLREIEGDFSVFKKKYESEGAELWS